MAITAYQVVRAASGDALERKVLELATANEDLVLVGGAQWNEQGREYFQTLAVETTGV